MKFAFLVGGFTGFALVTVAGFTAGRAADLVLRDAALGCLAGALLFLKGLPGRITPQQAWDATPAAEVPRPAPMAAPACWSARTAPPCR